MAWFDIPKAMRARLLATTAVTDVVASRVHYQELPQESVYPHVWFTRTSRDEDDALEGGHLVQERFAIEIVGLEDMEGLVDAIFGQLEPWRETLGGGQEIQLVDIEDADDDYVFRSVGEGDPTYLHALSVVVYWVKN